MTRQSRRREAAAASHARRTTQRRPARRPSLRPRGWSGRAYARLHRVARTRPLLVASALVALHVCLALLTFEPQPHTGGDNAAYLTLGRSLLEHGTYTELWDPAEPPHTKYPPVFPGILALAMAVGLASWVQLKLVVLALSASAVAFSYLWMRGRGRPVLGCVAALVIALSPGVLREGRWLLSDVPFWAFTMMGLWAFERLRGDRDWGRFALAAAAVLLAYFTRSAGLPLALAALGWLGWRRHWRQLAALALIIGIPAVLWWLRGRTFGPSGYVSEFWLINPYAPGLGTVGAGDLVSRFLQNNSRYVGTHLPILLGGVVNPLLLLASGLTFLLALFGWLLRARRARVAELFLPLYLGLIFIWPAVWSGERFLLPVLTLLLFYAGEALLRLVRRLAPGAIPVTGAAAAALLILLALPGLAISARVGMECTGRYRDGEQFPCLVPQWREFFELAPTARAVLPDGAVVINRKPRLFYGLGGPQGRMYPLTPDPAAFFATADSAGAGYVVLDRVSAQTEEYVVPAFQQYPRAFCIMLVSQQTQTALFGLVRDPAVRPGGVPVAADGSVGFDMCGPEYWRSEAAYRQYSTPR